LEDLALFAHYLALSFTCQSVISRHLIHKNLYTNLDESHCHCLVRCHDPSVISAVDIVPITKTIELYAKEAAPIDLLPRGLLGFFVRSCGGGLGDADRLRFVRHLVHSLDRVDNLGP
jgi:hypothetical protein